ncbi:MAG TPA: fibronectin type III domain-containing protein [Vicinamibacterales bacterium]|jgi:hypothetical protein
MTKTVRTITNFSLCATGALALTACEAEKSRNPLSPNVAGPIAGVSISVPTPASPVNGAEVTNTTPLRLTFNNSSSNGERPFWYIVELASDAGFTSKMYANGRVNPVPGSQTSIVVDTSLAPERTYYWRVKADDGANESAYSDAARFDLVVPIVIEAPVPVSPVNGQTTSTTNPVLTVNNGGIQGRAGHVQYWFEVAFDQAFARTLIQQGVDRSGGASTSAQMPELPSNTLFYWRVAGFNGTLVGTWSQTQSFRTPAAQAPAPSPSPGPGAPPPAAGCSAGGSPANWSDEQWRVCFFSLITERNAGGAVSVQGMAILRPDMVARGADFQNGWRGDMRPRLFLPVPGCPPATSPNVPACSYGRTIDLGDIGGPWQWIFRGQV